jgi:hypothetical protein
MAWRGTASRGVDFKDVKHLLTWQDVSPTQAVTNTNVLKVGKPSRPDDSYILLKQALKTITGAWL